SGSTRQSLYKLRLFTPDSIIPPLFEDKELEAYETKITAQVVPDYSDVDFSIYPRVCDDKNPMHRLWNDGAWIKAYLAHGCYWHKCAFCDTQLDYVCGYRPVDVEKLYQGLLKTAREQGIYGIHFVDEALPPRFLKAFALLNAQHGNPLYFWGNVRFEKAFDKDLAALLSYCGFGGASAGLEVATGAGLKAINKGVDIDSIISACAAFKEAGILVHAYMIYGFWYDDAQSIINSMETLRQFFQAGLLDSSFWHKFVLTRNSQVFFEWSQGKHPELNPIIPKASKSIFADNNLHFKGEDKYDKFGLPLENALDAWMHGDRLEMKVQKWFDFPVPSPNIPKDFIEKGIERYEERNNQKLNLSAGKELYWLGSDLISDNKNFILSDKKVIASSAKQSSQTWLYLQEEYSKKISPDLAQLLSDLKPSSSYKEREKAMETIKKSPDLQKQIQGLHNIGLVLA
nr:radical SAM protein [Treponema sp.]